MPSILYPTVIPIQRGIPNKDQLALPRDTYYRLNNDEPMFRYFVTQVSTPSPLVEKKHTYNSQSIIRDSILYKYYLSKYVVIVKIIFRYLSFLYENEILIKRQLPFKLYSLSFEKFQKLSKSNKSTLLPDFLTILKLESEFEFERVRSNTLFVTSFTVRLISIINNSILFDYLTEQIYDNC